MKKGAGINLFCVIFAVFLQIGKLRAPTFASEPERTDAELANGKRSAGETTSLRVRAAFGAGSSRRSEPGMRVSCRCL